MKVTRLKQGIRIRLTDTQYHVLCYIFGNGVEEPGDLALDTPGEVRALNHLLNNLNRVHEDRRHA